MAIDIHLTSLARNSLFMRPTGLIIIIREPLYYFFVLVGPALNVLKV
jgi:hypothetical protein